LSDPFGVGYGELVVCRLQTPVAEQRDLDHRVGRERASEKAADCGGCSLGLLGRADRSRVLVELLLRDRSDDAHARIRRKPGAAGKQHYRGEACHNGDRAELGSECPRNRRSAVGVGRPKM
jgi:hypothetical protein